MLPHGLKDLLTVGLLAFIFCRVKFFCRVLTLIPSRYIEVDFTFGLPDYVRYIEALFHIFNCNYDRDIENRSALYREAVRSTATVPG